MRNTKFRRKSTLCLTLLPALAYLDDLLIRDPGATVTHPLRQSAMQSLVGCIFLRRTPHHMFRVATEFALAQMTRVLTLVERLS